MHHLFSWIGNHATLISALANGLMVLIWLFYAQLFYRDFRERNAPRLTIHQAPDTTDGATCLLINMSDRALDIASIIAVGYGPNAHPHRLLVTDYDHHAAEETQLADAGQLKSSLKQGPLHASETMSLGTFHHLVQAIAATQAPGADDPPHQADQIHTLEIRVIFFFGAGHHPVGAYRRFTTTTEAGEARVHPQSLETKQLVSFWRRRQVKTWLRECM